MIFNITKSVLPKYTVNFPVQPAEDFCIQYNVDSENFYDMQTFPQGKLVLFNVRNFKNGMLERQGTDRDADGLCDLFLELGYVAYRYDNSTKAEILTVMEVASSDDYSNLSCFACVILANGEGDEVIYGTDQEIKINQVVSKFRNNKNLAGKPKLFFIQACRGKHNMKSYETDGGEGSGGIDISCLQLPREADFHFAFSTVPGYHSWKNTSRGSRFVETIISVFRKYAHEMDIMRMFLRVNAEMAQCTSVPSNYNNYIS